MKKLEKLQILLLLSLSLGNFLSIQSSQGYKTNTLLNSRLDSKRTNKRNVSHQLMSHDVFQSDRDLITYNDEIIVPKVLSKRSTALKANSNAIKDVYPESAMPSVTHQDLNYENGSGKQFWNTTRAADVSGFDMTTTRDIENAIRSTSYDLESPPTVDYQDYEDRRVDTHCFFDVEDDIPILCVPCNTSALPDFINDTFYNFIKDALYNDYDYYNLADLCYFTYEDIYGPGIRGTLLERNGSVTVILSDDKIIRVCKPIFQHFSTCKTNGSMTWCKDDHEDVMFFEDHSCQQETLNDPGLMAAAILQGEDECYQDLCSGSYRLVMENVQDVLVISLPISTNKCLTLTGMYLSVLIENFTTVYLTYNAYWPCCSGNYDVIWTENPEELGLVRNWSYLSLQCRIGEIILIGIMAIVAFVGITANTVVLSVMLRGGHRNEPSGIFRTSLSVADLLTSAFVALPAVYDSISLIMGWENENLHWNVNFTSSSWQNGVYFDEWFSPKNVSGTTLRYYKHYSYNDNWFRVVQAQILCLTSTVSLVMMFVLSLERFVITKYPLRYRSYFPPAKVKLILLFSWSLGLASVLSLTLKEDTFYAYWNSWTKFSFGFRGDPSISYDHYTAMSVLLCILTILTFIFSVSSLRNFCKEQAKRRIEMETFEMRVSPDHERENVYITISMLMITILYLLNVIPVGFVNIVEYDKSMFNTWIPIATFASWWAYLACSALNPIIYNLRSRQFRSDAAELLQDLLPKSCKSLMNPYVKYSRNKLIRYLQELDEEADETGKEHCGLPEGSRLKVLGLNFVGDR